MKKLISVVITLLLLVTVHAQLPDVISKTKSDLISNASPGKLLAQFSQAIKPTSFLSSWTGQKSSWIGKAGKVTDAIGMAQSISSLAGFIKPDMFKNGFNVSNLLQTAGTVKTIANATGVLKNLEGGLKPEALLGSWANQRGGWLSALSLLK